jgi:hypothetical protein
MTASDLAVAAPILQPLAEHEASENYLPATLAYAYLSAATDFEISQVVDLVKGAHARIRLATSPT